MTHVFWVTWVSTLTEAENISANGAMFRNALDALLQAAKDLQHIALQTGGKQYVGSFDAQNSGAKLVTYDTSFTEDLPRQQCPHFYYTLEDILFETVQKKGGKITWSVHRPGVLLGFAAGNPINLLGSLAVYSAICKHEGLPFTFRGNQFTWEAISDASSADLIAEQEIWAATDTRGKNQVFIAMNGDVFKWKQIWKDLAEKLGMEYIPFSGNQRH